MASARKIARRRGQAALTISGKAKGQEEVKRRTRNIAIAAEEILARRRIEEFLLTKTRDRFEPAGANPFAQRTPQGRFWKPVSEGTIPKRLNKNRRQALFNRGTLRDSLAVVRGNLFEAIRQGKASSIIGVRRGARNKKGVLLSTVARTMQSGGDTPQGKPIPPRVFLGISKADTKQIEKMMEDAMAKRLRG